MAPNPLKVRVLEQINDDVQFPKLVNVDDLSFSNIIITGGVISGVVITEAVALAISAAGTNQGDATAITFGLSEVTTVAAASGVVLPAAIAGRKALIVNQGANTLNIYPATGDDIDGAAANVAIILGVGRAITLRSVSGSSWYVSGGSPSEAVSLALSAAGTVQGDATGITFGLSELTTVAASTGVVLPDASTGIGKIVRVVNEGASTLNIFPASGDDIDGGSANAAITLAANVAISLMAVSASSWYVVGSTA